MIRLSDTLLDHLRSVVDLPELAGTRYELREKLGQGGMGAVYRAHDCELDREVALKVLHPGADESREESSRLLREAKIIAQLEHPGIVPVHDAGRLADGRVYYAMKCVRGRRLDSWLRQETPLHDRLRLFERICETIAFAHASGVLHRDLKPQNVMVGSFGEVLVMDWGIARKTDCNDAVSSASAVASPDTDHGRVMGTPGYMAPELASGDAASVDTRTDVFGLGTILYFLLHQRAPGDEPAKVGTETRTIPRPVDAICKRALAPEPADRYDSADDLAADIGRYLTGLPVSAYPESLWTAGIRLVAKHHTPVILVAAYLLMRALLFLLRGV